MHKQLLRIQVRTTNSTRTLDLLKVGAFEHWIIPAWLEDGTGRYPARLIRLEGLPFLPAASTTSAFTLTAQLPEELLEGCSRKFEGRTVEMIEGSSSYARRLCSGVASPMPELSGQARRDVGRRHPFLSRFTRRHASAIEA